MTVVALLFASVLWPTVLLAAPLGEGRLPLDVAAGTSTWVNRHGSVMVLDRGRDGLLQGYFVNNAPGKGCRGIPYELSGRMVKETIAFQVSWRNGVADCPMETQWRGHIQPSREGGLEIVAEWQQSSTVLSIGLGNDEPQKGTDHFTLQVATGLHSQITPPGISAIP
jgi:hypothetical protein